MFDTASPHPVDQRGDQATVRFTVLGSGSSGNASLFEANGFGLLIDAGLGPRQLAQRLAAVGLAWDRIDAVLITHTHTDHWKDRTLAQMRRRRLRLFCHADHHETLAALANEYTKLHTERLVEFYTAQTAWGPAPHLKVVAFPLPHDGGATFGFRVEVTIDGESTLRLGYAADLGSWTQEIVQALSDVDILALEFNHDIELEYSSGRSAQLIHRVIGDHGHLSNAQAAALLSQILACSQTGRPQHVIQLHLSRDCNHPALAASAARDALALHGSSARLHTASQYVCGPMLHVGRAQVNTSSDCPEFDADRINIDTTSSGYLPGCSW